MSCREFENVSVQSANRIKWRIKNFFCRIQTYAFCKSPTFHSCNAVWHLTVDIIWRASTVRKVSMYLQKDESQEFLDRVTFVLGIHKYNDGVYRCLSKTCSFETTAYGGSSLVKFSELLKDRGIVEQKGYVTFFCLIYIPGKSLVDASQQTFVVNDFSALSLEYKNLLLSGNGSDVTIRVQDRSFRVHSHILATRSPVFATMFSHDMKEKNTGIVEVKDCDPDAFREFLVFLYSGQAENITSDNVMHVYHIAEKYDLKGLKIVCSDLMKKEMNVDVFSDILFAAETYGNAELIRFSEEYFLKNMK